MVTEGIGIMVGNLEADNWKDDGADKHVAKLAANKGTYILAQTHNGGKQCTDEQVEPWIAACAKYKIAFGIWGVTYTEPERDAQIHANHIRRYRPAVAAINAEIFYQGNPNVGGEERIRWERNYRYLDAFDAGDLGPMPPVLVLSTTGAASGNNVYWMPHSRWMERHEVHAQAYYNAHDDYRPDLCQAHWLRAGWPLNKIRLTLGCYTGEGKGLTMHLPDYLPLLQNVTVVGMNLFVAETLVDEDFKAMPDLIAMGRAKANVIPPSPPTTDVAANRNAAIKLLDESVEFWRVSGMKEETIAIQRQALAHRVLHMVQSGSNLRTLKALLDRMGAPSP